MKRNKLTHNDKVCIGILIFEFLVLIGIIAFWILVFMALIKFVKGF